MEIEKRNRLKDLWPVAILLVGFLALGGLKYMEVVNQKTDAEKHIKIVTATDKNCNDCHLGASFVNLFNHPAVKGNDNTVLLMMDKAKIKRW